MLKDASFWTWWLSPQVFRLQRKKLNDFGLSLFVCSQILKVVNCSRSFVNDPFLKKKKTPRFWLRVLPGSWWRDGNTPRTADRMQRAPCQNSHSEPFGLVASDWSFSTKCEGRDVTSKGLCFVSVQGFSAKRSKHSWQRKPCNPDRCVIRGCQELSMFKPSSSTVCQSNQKTTQFVPNLKLNSCFVPTQKVRKQSLGLCFLWTNKVWKISRRLW